MEAQSIESIAENPKPKHAGGRPKGQTSKVLWAKARGLNPIYALEILGRYDEHRLWARALNSDDDRVMLQALVYLTDRRDGRPAQQINVTSQNISISVDDVERARAIVREIRAGSALNPRHERGTSSPLQTAGMVTPALPEGDDGNITVQAVDSTGDMGT